MKCVYGCVVCNRRYRLYAEKYWFGMVARNARRSGRYFGLLESLLNSRVDIFALVVALVGESNRRF